jgi:hypothetical protein
MHELLVHKEGVRTYCELGITIYGQDFEVSCGFPKQLSAHNVVPFLICLVNILTNFCTNQLLRVTLPMKPPLQANQEQMEKKFCVGAIIVSSFELNPLPNV